MNIIYIYIGLLVWVLKFTVVLIKYTLRVACIHIKIDDYVLHAKLIYTVSL